MNFQLNFTFLVFLVLVITQQLAQSTMVRGTRTDAKLIFCCQHLEEGHSPSEGATSSRLMSIFR